MCNAKTHRSSHGEAVQLSRHLASQLQRTLGEVPLYHTPRYRIGIKQQHVIFRPHQSGVLSGQNALWGLVPPGKPDDRAARTNARADSLNIKWPWKLVLRNRCVVPADGFFEAEKVTGDKSKVPWRIYQMKDSALFWMAGLYAVNEADVTDSETGEITKQQITSYTIITTDANDVIYIHDRMPVIFTDQADAARWLADETIPQDLLVPYANENMEGWRVPDAAKNSGSADTEALIRRVGVEPQTGTLL